MALPALLGGAGRALATTSKVSRAVNIGSKFLGKDTKKKKPGMGTEKGSSSLTVRPSMSMVPAFKTPNTQSTDTSEPKTSTSGGDSLEENVAYIRKKTVEIDKLLKESFKLRKKEAKDAEKMRRALARKEKEDRFESGKSVVGKVAKRAGKPFSSIFDAIKNYISSIIVGFIAIKLLPLLPQMLQLLKVVGPAMDFILGIAGKLLDGLVTFVDWGYKAYDATRGFIKDIGGEGAAEAFDKFSGAMNTMINLALILAMAQSIGGGFGGGRGGRGGRGGSTRPTTRPGQGLRPKVTTTGGRSANRPDFRNPFRQGPKVTGSGGGFNPFRNFKNPFAKGPRITGTGAGLFGTGLFAGGFQNPFAPKPNVTTGSGQAPKVTGSGGGGFQFRNPFAQGPKITGSGAAQPGVLSKATNVLRSFKLPKMPSLPPGVSRALGGMGRSLGYIALVPVAFEVVDMLIKKRYKDAVRTIITAGLSAVVFQTIFGVSGAAAVLKTIFTGGAATPLAIATLIGGTALATGASVGTSMGADALLRKLGLEDQPEVQLEDLTQVEAKESGGQVGKRDDDKKQALQQQQLIPVFKTPDLGIADIGKNIGGPKAVDNLYKQEGVQNLIRLYNEVKEVPVYGEAMATAIGMALGNTPPSTAYLSMGASLLNFSNLQAAEDIASSSAKISQSAQKFEEGGQVLVSKVSLGNSIEETANVANYLRTQISSIKVKPEERTPEGIARILEMLGIKSDDYQMQEGGPSSSYPPTTSSPSSSGGASGAVSGSPEMRALLDVLAFAEGTLTNRNGATGPAGYSTWAGYQMHGPTDLTGLTIQEVHDLQTSFMRQGKTRMTGSAVVGRYQFKDLLKYYAPLAGLSGSDKFSPENQDLMAIAEIKKRAGITTQMLKDQGLTQAMLDKLAPIWASMPYSPKGGASYYGGQPSKSASSLKSQYATRLGVAQEREKAQVAKPEPQSGGLLDPVLNMLGMGSQQQSQEQGESKGLIGSVVQWLHGNPNRAGYDAGHAGMSNAHDHFSFNSRSAAVRAFKALKKAGYAPYEFEGFTAVGKHSPRGGHFGPVGQPPTYDDKTDGVAFDIPWSSYGSGPIGQRDYDKSYRAAQIVGAAQGGGPVPGAFKELQETMGYDKSKTRVLIQPMIVEKEVPMPMPSGGGGGGIMVMGGEVNNTTDSLAAG